MRPTFEQSGQLISMFGLAPGADRPFHQILRRPQHQSASSQLSLGCVVSVPLQGFSPLPLAWFPGPE